MAGVDEAGRGPLAGPVVAAAVILDDAPADPRPRRLEGAHRRAARAARRRRSAPARCAVAVAAGERRGDRHAQHPARHAARDAARGRGAAADAAARCWSTATSCRRWRCRCRRHRRRRRPGEGDLGGVDPRQGAPRPAVPGAARAPSRSTASTATRATRRRRIWPRCACTAPARCTGARFAPVRAVLAAAADAWQPQTPARSCGSVAAAACGPLPTSCGRQRRAWSRRSGSRVDRSAAPTASAPPTPTRRCAGMSAATPSRITSRDNPLLVRLRQLAQDAGAYRRHGTVWLDGEHLCSAAAQRGRHAAQAVVTESAWQRPALRALAAAMPTGWRSFPMRSTPRSARCRRPAASASSCRSARRRRSIRGRQHRARPGAGRRQRRQRAAQRGGLRLRAGAGAQGHGDAVVAEGAARRHGRAFRAAAGRGARRRARSTRSRCRWSPPARTRDAGAARRARCRTPAPGCSATKGRACGRSCWRDARCAVRIPQPGGEESLNVAAAAAVCLYDGVRRRAAARPTGRSRRAADAPHASGPGRPRAASSLPAWRARGMRWFDRLGAPHPRRSRCRRQALRRPACMPAASAVRAVEPARTPSAARNVVAARRRMPTQSPNPRDPWTLKTLAASARPSGTGTEAAVAEARLAERPAPRVAVLVPCYNEAVAIAKVVARLPRRAAGRARSTSTTTTRATSTAELARAAGAIVRSETRQGKGHVVRRMFADVEADIYVHGRRRRHLRRGRARGDDRRRCCAQEPRHGRRRRVDQQVEAYRPGHRFGNALLTGMVRRLFGDRISDMLSGYRVFSRRFVKSFPALSAGFETETEFTVHALELKLPIGEIETPTARGRRARSASSTPTATGCASCG